MKKFLKVLQNVSFLMILIAATGDTWLNLAVVLTAGVFFTVSTLKLKEHV